MSTFFFSSYAYLLGEGVASVERIYQESDDDPRSFWEGSGRESLSAGTTSRTKMSLPPPDACRIRLRASGRGNGLLVRGDASCCCHLAKAPVPWICRVAASRLVRPRRIKGKCRPLRGGTIPPLLLRLLRGKAVLAAQPRENGPPGLGIIPWDTCGSSGLCLLYPCLVSHLGSSLRIVRITPSRSTALTPTKDVILACSI